MTNIFSLTLNTQLVSDYHASSKEHVDDSIVENTNLRFNQTLENYLKVFVRNDI